MPVRPPRRLPLRWFLTVPYVIQIIVIVGLTGWLSHYHGQKTVSKLASDLLVQAKYRVRERTNHLLQHSQELAQTNAFAYEQGYIDLDRPQAMQRHFWEQIHKRINPPEEIFIGNEQGTLLAVRKDSVAMVEPLASHPTKSQQTLYPLDIVGNRQQQTQSTQDDPRQRPWYIKAKQVKGVAWTKPYVFLTGEVGITVAQHIRDRNGRIQAVSGVDLSLEQLNTYLRQIKVSPSFQIYIVDRDGKLVASSAKDSLTPDPNGRLPLAIQSDNSVIRESSRDLLAQAGDFDQLDESQDLESVIQDQRHYLSILPYDYQDQLGWRMVIVVPEQDFTQQIAQNNRTTLMFCVLSLGLAVTIGILTSRVLTRTILHLAATFDQVATGEWTSTDLTVARTQEMGVLLSSFDQMVQQLGTTFQELENYAYQDALTGLPNRAAFLVQLEYAITAAHAQGSSLPNFAVLWLDIDSFVRIETGLGEHTAMQLLQEVAHRLQRCLQTKTSSVTTLARIERDDFVILLGQLTDEFAARRMAEQILQDFQAPFRLGQQDVVVTASIGMVINQGEKEPPETVLRNANIARFEAKRGGKARYMIFDHHMREHSAERLQLEADLRYAIERDELEVWYQPIIGINPGRTIGFEALLRWRHPTAGLISPVKFIPIAEETGVIAAMGLWVLRTACEQMQLWQIQLPRLQPAFISVNVSAQQLLLPDFVDKVEDILGSTGFSGKFLQLEVTESAAVSQPETIGPKLQHLKSLGISICMDDFGTGYCQLSYLVQLPVDAIKIDRSFVDEMGTDNSNAEIAKSLLTLSESLALDATAEGIETPQQFWELQLLGCQKFQGYLFAAPMQAERVPHFHPSLPETRQELLTGE